jgi:hypothetical protein
MSRPVSFLCIYAKTTTLTHKKTHRIFLRDRRAAALHRSTPYSLHAPKNPRNRQDHPKNSHLPATAGNTSFIAISTLTTELNFYSKLISKVDPLTNTPMFRAIQIQLACAACIAAEKAHECQHMAHLIPRWQDSEKHRKLKTIMSDRADLINSELGGIAVGNNDQCFRLVDLKRMFDNVIHMDIESHVPFFVTIDPCAGGEHSDFAMVSFVVSHGVYQVLGAEALQTKVTLL